MMEADDVITLSDLRAPAPGRIVEPASWGFVVVREAAADREAFDALVRAIIDAPSDDYVALPVSDGLRGYERLVVLPYETSAEV